MFRMFYPKFDVESSYVIDYEKLYSEGYRGIIYDIDNTLVTHGSPADDRAKELIKRLKGIGFKVVLISNNKIKRVSSFANDVGLPFIEDAHKPSKKPYLRAVEMMGTDIDTTIFVGDQLFTDVWGANRCKITSFLVKPIHKSEEIQIVIKRRLEKLVLFYYYKNKKEV